MVPTELKSGGGDASPPSPTDLRPCIIQVVIGGYGIFCLLSFPLLVVVVMCYVLDVVDIVIS